MDPENIETLTPNSSDSSSLRYSYFWYDFGCLSGFSVVRLETDNKKRETSSSQQAYYYIKPAELEPSYLGGERVMASSSEKLVG